MTGDHPVLVTAAEAIEILGVSDSTFARLRREGQFENMGGAGLFRSAQLRAYRAGDGRRRTIANTKIEPRKTADLNGTAEPKITPQTRNDLRLGNDTRRTCQGCGRPFLARRSDARTCSPACRKRVLRHPA